MPWVGGYPAFVKLSSHLPLPYLVPLPPSMERQQMTVWEPPELRLFFHRKTCFSCAWRWKGYYHKNRTSNRSLDFLVSEKKQACLGDQEAGGPCYPCGIQIKKRATIHYPPKWHQGKHKQIWFPRGSLHSKGHCSPGAAPDTRPVVPDQLARPQFPGVKSQQRSLHPLGDFPLRLCCCFLMDLLCLSSKQ